MDKLRSTCLMMLCCFILESINGKGNEDLFSSCETEVMVQRRTTWRASPQKALTVKCPVKHCGESLNVTWCKLSSRNNCEPIKTNDTVNITQTYHKDKLISYLTFKAISTFDDGLYRCYSKEHKTELSHVINISVSDVNEGFENSVDRLYMDQLPHPSDHNLSWLPYFCICVGIALLAFVVTMLTHLTYHGWKVQLKYNATHGKETPRPRMIPALPKRSDPNAPVLQTHFTVLNDIYFPCPSRIHPSPPFKTSSGSEPPANTMANNGQAPEYAVYAVIDHKQPKSAARKEHTETRSPEYSAINVS